ncbi:hypothetical protein Har1130_17455 [Haloarcula sp. CBA1130]|nr:hypothetical protein Har1130_17455 [Haloarcula sp. CBA1130]KAA9397680.1 hypothetical protein Har1129_05350 [Haloarcula sp. CBA1129]
MSVISSGSAATDTQQHAADIGSLEQNETVITTSGEQLTLQTTAAEQIHGQTAVSPGSNVTVRIESSDTQNPFLIPQSTPVRENGTFAVKVDLSGITNNTSAVVSVYHNTTELTNQTARIESVRTKSTPATAESLPRFVFDGNQISVASAPNQTIRGETTFDSRTNVTVLIKSTDSSSPFLRSQQATVRSNGSVATRFNFTAVPEGTTFQAELRKNGTSLTDAEGQVTGD